jgi:heme-degrading monooxygenase HmoA
MWVSLTRLRIISPVTYPWALLQSVRTARAAARSPGFRDGRILRAERRTLWTITGWTDAEAMRAYRDHGLHRALMARLVTWCDEAAVAHWDQPDDEPLPGWAEAHERLQRTGRASRVKHPSPDHAAFRIGPLGSLDGASRELPLSILAGRL